MSDNRDQSCTITVRVIRSLEHKNWRPLVIRGCELDMWTLNRLRKVVEEGILDPGSGFPPPFSRDLWYYDRIKLETNPGANRAKSSDYLINTETPSVSFVLDGDGMDVTLSSLGFFDECEVSVFNSGDYDKYLSRI